MENLQEQELKIEDARTRLGELVLAKGFNMQDADLILLSDEMNRLIVDFEKAKQACIMRRRL
ncbi:hypothetical protein SOV_50080 [Sporomusa ovata DSM 2662]|uniref:Spo0E like sporulation regulatory protein n=1 Tax=Sporomusa ovata TaxID=2378 RepID=A0A0U1L2S5_9FIRM|nr:hypothetical protein [Sporomusa ovata]EQB27381.1 hypothetical protein SOV_2c02770 [Sporomusa ovata DSM 2662]CQR73224.1 hypothetical protein SpAn4DRAFT_2456 [Sporomusa ovata]